MVYPGLVLPYLADYFNVPTPNFVVGARLPKNILGLYDSKTMTIYFRDRDPSIDVIAHEFGHHLHNIYGIRGSRVQLESLANRIEKALTEFYGREPNVYGMVLNNYGWIFIFSGFIFMIIGFVK